MVSLGRCKLKNPPMNFRLPADLPEALDSSVAQTWISAGQSGSHRADVFFVILEAERALLVLIEEMWRLLQFVPRRFSNSSLHARQSLTLARPRTALCASYAQLLLTGRGCEYWMVSLIFLGRFHNVESSE